MCIECVGLYVLNELTHVEHLEQCLIHSKYPMNVSDDDNDDNDCEP